MEYKLAHKFLYDKAIEKGFIQLANHIKKVGPLRIKVSKMDFVSHLSKIIIGQQLSVQSAAAIWKRTDKILKENKYKKENIKLNQKFRDAGLSRQKIEYLNGIIFNKDLINISKKELNRMSAAEYFDFLIQIKGIGPWSIEMSRIFFIGDPDVFSILDLGLRNAHLKMFKIDSYKESFYDNFMPYRSYMCLFLWRVLEDENVTI